MVWGVLLDYYGYQNGFVVFSALAIFSTVAFPVLLITKGLLKKDMTEILIWKYMRNKISPSRRLGLIFVFILILNLKRTFSSCLLATSFWKYEWLKIHSLSRLASSYK